MKNLLLIVCVLVSTAVSVSTREQNGAKPFPLTVDSIMRGPELVGNPPNNLRWSGDSKELYFEWLIPKDDQASTWVVGRDGGAPKRLSEIERRTAPLANGQWDAKRRRILGVDRGDIVIIDTVARRRIDVTRTTGNESSPRWARGETHVTFVRDNNLFIVPIESVGTGGVVQLTDVSARRADPRVTDSQKFLKEEEPKILDWVEQEAARRKRREDLDKSRALPKFELAERQNIADAAVSGDGKFAFLVVNDRAQSRTAQVPRFVSESSFTEEIQARTFVGDTQDRRRIAVLNLESGEAVWAGLDGISDPIAIPKPPFGDEPRPASKPDPDPAPKRDVRWGNPSYRPTAGLPSLQFAPPTTPSAGSRRSILRLARRRCSITSRTMRGCVTAGRAGLPDGKRAMVPRRARRLDAPLHRRRHLIVPGPEAADEREGSRSIRSSCRRTAARSTSSQTKRIRASGRSMR